MALLLLGVVAFLASGMTFFSGFGLGTILMPTFALFFPVSEAIAASALVHFVNNIFKLFLVGKNTNVPVMVRFGIPAILGAILGASLLNKLQDYETSANFSPIKFTIGLLIIIFALLELWPRASTLAFPRKYLPLGGILSGFFGGLSGHQGALRSAFLIKAGLTKNAFIATGVVLAIMVDAGRLAVYGASSIVPTMLNTQNMALALLVAVISALGGSFVGNALLHKTSMPSVKLLVAVMMIMVGIGLMSGLI